MKIKNRKFTISRGQNTPKRGRTPGAQRINIFDEKRRSHQSLPKKGKARRKIKLGAINLGTPVNMSPTKSYSRNQSLNKDSKMPKRKRKIKLLFPMEQKEETPVTKASSHKTKNSIYSKVRTRLKEVKQAGGPTESNCSAGNFLDDSSKQTPVEKGNFRTFHDFAKEAKKRQLSRKRRGRRDRREENKTNSLSREKSKFICSSVSSTSKASLKAQKNKKGDQSGVRSIPETPKMALKKRPEDIKYFKDMFKNFNPIRPISIKQMYKIN